MIPHFRPRPRSQFPPPPPFLLHLPLHNLVHIIFLPLAQKLRFQVTRDPTLLVPREPHHSLRHGPRVVQEGPVFHGVVFPDLGIGVGGEEEIGAVGEDDAGGLERQRLEAEDWVPQGVIVGGDVAGQGQDLDVDVEALEARELFQEARGGDWVPIVAQVELDVEVGKELLLSAVEVCEEESEGFGFHEVEGVGGPEAVETFVVGLAADAQE